MQIRLIPIEQLKRDPNQPRQTLDQEHINDMAQSIETEGVINPIEVDESYTIITGEMRWRASKKAGLKEVPCKILKISEGERFRRQVIENIHHNTMTDWDTAKALKKLLIVALGDEPYQGGDIGVSKLARMIGKSKRYITDHLDILNSSAPIQAAIKDAKIPYTFIRPIRRIDPAYKEIMEAKILAGHFKTRDDALEMVVALQHNPEKAQQILKAESRAELHRIVPPAHEIVKAKLLPTTEFLKIQKEILEWVSHNRPEDIITKDRFLLLLAMSTVVDKLNAWGKVANQLKLKG